MNLIDKEHIALSEIRQYRGEVTLSLNGGTRCYAHLDTEFIRDNAGQSRFPQSGRTVQENVVKRFATCVCRFDGDAQIGFHSFLPEILAPARRTQLRLLRIFAKRFPRENAFLIEMIAHLVVIHQALKLVHGISHPHLHTMVSEKRGTVRDISTSLSFIDGKHGLGARIKGWRADRALS